MVRTRQPAPSILPVAWKPSDGRAQLEVLRHAELAPRIIRAVERPEFHVFILFTRGTCRHDLDFEHLDCRPGTLIHVRPGQVQRWRLRDGVDGIVLVFEPTLLLTAVSRRSHAQPAEQGLDLDEAWPSLVDLPGDDFTAATDWLLRIEGAARESHGALQSRAILRHLVSAALLDLARRSPFARSPPRVAPAALATVRRFQADIARSYCVTRTVADYAARLSCSARTLDRLARATFGMSAKRLIDARVVLEARRLLAHTNLTVAAIGDSLGFEEATNFVKFFRARTRESPGRFRTRAMR